MFMYYAVIASLPSLNIYAIIKFNRSYKATNLKTNKMTYILDSFSNSIFVVALSDDY